ncbi:Spike glycoprotein [Frankliniella fusca]|uniref:Spike glycoprotein n=1 Tax=Frankliniella fusca TaxID=407009 RepID=A0AAE1LLC6_9NEOP|nr:Spike glycoprotein [Frankliniella fusca]
MEELPTSLKQYMEVRWSSCYRMLESIKNAYAEVQAVLERKNAASKLDDIPLQFLTEVVDLLQPLKLETERAQHKNCVTASLPLVSYHSLRQAYSPDEDDSEPIRMMRARLHQELANVVELTDTHKIASFLDPSFRGFRNILCEAEKSEPLGQSAPFEDEVEAYLQEPLGFDFDENKQLSWWMRRLHCPAERKRAHRLATLFHFKMTSKTRGGSKQTEKVAEMERGELESLILKTVQVALKPVSDSLETLTKEIEELKVDLQQNDHRISKLEKFVENKLDELEQYGRRNNLRIFGVPEKPGEDTDDIVLQVAEKMGVELDKSVIDRSHRVGKRGSQARPIIVKFIGYGPRRTMFTNKKNLKNSKITVREDLTAYRLQVLKEAVSRYGMKQVWSRDGIIKINVGSQEPVGVKTLEYLNSITMDYPPPTK